MTDWRALLAAVATGVTGTRVTKFTAFFSCLACAIGFAVHWHITVSFWSSEEWFPRVVLPPRWFLPFLRLYIPIFFVLLAFQPNNLSEARRVAAFAGAIFVFCASIATVFLDLFLWYNGVLTWRNGPKWHYILLSSPVIGAVLCLCLIAVIVRAVTECSEDTGSEDLDSNPNPSRWPAWLIGAVNITTTVCVVASQIICQSFYLFQGLLSISFCLVSTLCVYRRENLDRPSVLLKGSLFLGLLSLNRETGGIGWNAGRVHDLVFYAKSLLKQKGESVSYQSTVDSTYSPCWIDRMFYASSPRWIDVSPLLALVECISVIISVIFLVVFCSGTGSGSSKSAVKYKPNNRLLIPHIGLCIVWISLDFYGFRSHFINDNYMILHYSPYLPVTLLSGVVAFLLTYLRPVLCSILLPFVVEQLLQSMVIAFSIVLGVVQATATESGLKKVWNERFVISLLQASIGVFTIVLCCFILFALIRHRFTNCSETIVLKRANKYSGRSRILCFLLMLCVVSFILIKYFLITAAAAKYFLITGADHTESEKFLLVVPTLIGEIPLLSVLVVFAVFSNFGSDFLENVAIYLIVRYLRVLVFQSNGMMLLFRDTLLCYFLFPFSPLICILFLVTLFEQRSPITEL